MPCNSRALNFPAGIYMCKVNNGNTRTMREIWSKLPVKASLGRQWRLFRDLLLTLNEFQALFRYFLC